MAPLCPWRTCHTRGRRWRRATTGCVHPPQTAPGLGPPRTRNGAWIQTFLLECRMNYEDRIIPAATLPGGGQIEQGHPGTGRPFTASVFAPCSFKTSSVLLFANFLASALTSERGLYAFFLTRLEVKGVALNLLDDVFLLHLALEPAQGVLEGFTLLQSNFRQTDTPPNPSGRTE
jgi:hypothetical protein